MAQSGSSLNAEFAAPADSPPAQPEQYSIQGREICI
jgi:hypothetical protein